MPSVSFAKPPSFVLFRRLSDGKLFHFELLVSSETGGRYFQSADGVRLISETATITLEGTASPCSFVGIKTVEQLNSDHAAAQTERSESKLPGSKTFYEATERAKLEQFQAMVERDRPWKEIGAQPLRLDPFTAGIAQANRKQIVEKFTPSKSDVSRSETNTGENL